MEPHKSITDYMATLKLTYYESGLNIYSSFLFFAMHISEHITFLLYELGRVSFRLFCRAFLLLLSIPRIDL